MMVTALELLKTSNLVPSGLETKVCALGMLIVAVRPPAVRFITSTAPGDGPVSKGAGWHCRVAETSVQGDHAGGRPRQ